MIQASMGKAWHLHSAHLFGFKSRVLGNQLKVPKPPVRMNDEDDRVMEQCLFIRSCSGKLSTASPPSADSSSVVKGESNPPTSRTF